MKLKLLIDGGCGCIEHPAPEGTVAMCHCIGCGTNSKPLLYEYSKYGEFKGMMCGPCWMSKAES